MKPSPEQERAAREWFLDQNAKYVCVSCSYGSTKLGRYVHMLCDSCFKKSKVLACLLAEREAGEGERLAARCKRLEEALRPFAECLEDPLGQPFQLLTDDQLHAARAALEPDK